MKNSQSLLKKFIASITLGLALTVFCENAFAGSQNQAFKRLERLPIGMTSFSKVGPLVKTLIKSNPSKAFTYYRMGFERLFESELGINNLVLTHQAFIEIRKSDLSMIQKNRIMSKIDNYYYNHISQIR
jgi:hypothetical protein